MQLFFYLFILSKCVLFILIRQVDCNRIHTVWIEVFHAAVHHCLQISLGNTMEDLLAVYLDSYWLLEVHQLFVEIHPQSATGSYSVVAIELQVDAPHLVLHRRNVFYVTYLDRNHVLVDIHLVVCSCL